MLFNTIFVSINVAILFYTYDVCSSRKIVERNACHIILLIYLLTISCEYRNCCIVAKSYSIISKCSLNSAIYSYTFYTCSKSIDIFNLNSNCIRNSITQSIACNNISLCILFECKFYICVCRISLGNFCQRLFFHSEVYTILLEAIVFNILWILPLKTCVVCLLQVSNITRSLNLTTCQSKICYSRKLCIYCYLYRGC